MTTDEIEKAIEFLFMIIFVIKAATNNEMIIKRTMIVFTIRFSVDWEN
jgi:hypothetical protein